MEEFKRNEHRRKMFSIADKLNIEIGAHFFLDGEGGIVLLGSEGKQDLSLKYEGIESKKDDFLKLTCYLLNKEIDVISKRDSAELSDLLPAGSLT